MEIEHRLAQKMKSAFFSEYLVKAYDSKPYKDLMDKSDKIIGVVTGVAMLAGILTGGLFVGLAAGALCALTSVALIASEGTRILTNEAEKSYDADMANGVLAKRLEAEAASRLTAGVTAEFTAATMVNKPDTGNAPAPAAKPDAPKA